MTTMAAKATWVGQAGPQGQLLFQQRTQRRRIGRLLFANDP
jgi:hypothetical protein